jgi:hypothetical protein
MYRSIHSVSTPPEPTHAEYLNLHPAEDPLGSHPHFYVEQSALLLVEAGQASTRPSYLPQFATSSAGATVVNLM